MAHRVKVMHLSAWGRCMNFVKKARKAGDTKAVEEWTRAARGAWAMAEHYSPQSFTRGGGLIRG